MKRAIIIPTYQGHFKFIKNLLNSMYKFITDKENIDIVFILSNQNEENEFNAIFQKYFYKLNIKTENIDNIVKSYGYDFSTEKYIKKLGKYNYQTIKKLYAVDYLNYEQALIIDSESLFLKKVDVNALFDEYFSAPYIMYSQDLEKDNNCLAFKTDLNFLAHRNSSAIFNIEPSNTWYFEAFHWFYDKKIIKDLFKYFNNNLFEGILNISEKYDSESDKAIFEPEVYYIWIKEVCKNKYNYNLINIKKETEILFGEYYQNILKPRMYKFDYIRFPFFQHCFECLNINDLEKFCSLYKKYNLRIARLCLRPLDKMVVYKFLIFSDVVLAVSTNNIQEYNNILNINFMQRVFYETKFKIDCLLKRKILKLLHIKTCSILFLKGVWRKIKK